MAFFKPDPSDIRVARRAIHREALIRGSVFIAQRAEPAAIAAMDELVDEGVATRRGDRGVAITEDTDAIRAARAIMLALEASGGTITVDNLAERIAHTEATTSAALGYIRGHKLVALRDGALTDLTGDELRGRKESLPVDSLELARIERTARAVRKNVEALGESTGKWFAHPNDDRWTPEALREIRTATNKAFRALPPSKRWKEERFRRDTAAHFTTDHVDEVMARLEAVNFITVADGWVTSHAALPAPKPEPEPIPEPAPAPPADLGEIPETSLNPPLTPAPKPAPKAVEQKPVAPAAAPKPDETPKPSGTDPKPETPKPEDSGQVASAIGQSAADTETPAKPAKTKDAEKPAPVNAGALEKRLDTLTTEVRAIGKRLHTLPAPPTKEQVMLTDADPLARRVLETVLVQLKLKKRLAEAEEGKGEPHFAMTRDDLKSRVPGRARVTATNPTPPDLRQYLDAALEVGRAMGVIECTDTRRGGSYVFITHVHVMSRAELDRRVQRVLDIRAARAEKQDAA